MKITEMIEAARLRAGAMLRERKERAAERKLDNAARRAAANPPGVTIFEWQVRSAHIMSWLAAATAAYFLWSYCVGIAGDQSNALHITHAGTWIGEILFFFPLIVGFVLIAFSVPYLAKGIIPIFVALTWRQHFWPKFWSLMLVVAASFALIASSFSVMGGAIIEHGRGAAVAVDQVRQSHAGLQAQIDGEQSDLHDMLSNSNAYMAQAANVGAAAWAATYIPQARRTNDARLPMIERALGAAQAADAKRAHIAQLRIQLATAATESSVAATPEAEQSNWIVGVMAWIRGAWALIMSVLNDIVCLLMGWIALRLQQARSVQLGMAGGIPQHPWMIEDHAGERLDAVTPREAAIAVFKRGGTREEAEEAAYAKAGAASRQSTLHDADTDEVIIDRDGDLARKVREHTRKVKGKDGKPVKMVLPAEAAPPDEVGVEVDGGRRIGSSGAVKGSVPEADYVEAATDNKIPEGINEVAADDAETYAEQPRDDHNSNGNAPHSSSSLSADDILGLSGPEFVDRGLTEPDQQENHDGDNGDDAVSDVHLEPPPADAAPAEEANTKDEGEQQSIRDAHDDILDQGITDAFRQPITDRTRLLESAK